jgi:phospholipase/carboxylesterase
MLAKIIILFIMTIPTVKFNFAIGDTMLLHYIVRQPKIAVDSPPLLILLHGVGSNEQDLFSMANQLPDNFLIISARAPFKISEGNYMWYEVDFGSGKPVINSEQAEKSRTILIKFISQLKEKHQFNHREIFIGGFSQGAIMSYSVGLTRPDKVKGIIALSGRVLKEIKPIIATKEKLASLKALIIHGTTDNILPINHARESKALLGELDINTTYLELETGHNLTDEGIQFMNQWLKKNSTTEKIVAK